MRKGVLLRSVNEENCEDVWTTITTYDFEKDKQILRKKVLLRSVNEENCEDVWTTPREVFAPLLPRSQHRVKKCFPQLQHEVSENQISPK